MRIAWLFLFSISFLTAGPADQALQAIYNNRLPELTRYLKDGDPNARISRDNTLLMYTAAFGTVDAMRLLLAAGADPNLKNAFDATALMWASYSPERVTLLLEKGADPNAKSKSGKTALLIAAFSPNGGDVVKILAAHHADLKATDDFGSNLLLSGSYSRNITAVRLALANKADPNAALRNGFTSLMNSASDGSFEITKLLLDAGADPNARSAPANIQAKYGLMALGEFTPLIFATPYGPPSVVKLLLDRGAKVDPADARNMTALHAAVSSEAQNAETVRLLIARGADPSLKNKEGVTATDWAAKFSRPDVLQAIRYTPSKATTPAAAETKTTTKDAVSRGINLMETSSAAFFEKSGCVSCHSQNITGILAGVARAHRVPMNPEASTLRVATVKSSWAPQAEGLLVREDPPGGADMVGYALLGLAGEGYAPDFTTAAMARNLAVQQMPDGSWHRGGIARVPVEDSDIALTAAALRCLQVYEAPGTHAEYTQRIRQAREWLIKAKPTYADERNFRLLGLKWSGAPPDLISLAAKDIAAKQRPSGGWGQNDYLAEDAYATGQTLYALSEAGLPANAKGIAYLVRTQAPDGSWHVVSRAVKFQPYFQGGFPYDHDQWVSSMGTGWATIALTTNGEIF